MIIRSILPFRRLPAFAPRNRPSAGGEVWWGFRSRALLCKSSPSRARASGCAPATSTGAKAPSWPDCDDSLRKRVAWSCRPMRPNRATSRRRSNPGQIGSGAAGLRGKPLAIPQIARRTGRKAAGAASGTATSCAIAGQGRSGPDAIRPSGELRNNSSCCHFLRDDEHYPCAGSPNRSESSS